MRLWTQTPKLTLSAIPAYILFFVVAFAPLPFGSYDKGTVAVWCGILGLAAAATSLSNFPLRRGHLLLLAGIGLIVLFYAFVLHEQLSDHPWIAKPHPIWAQTSKVLGVDIVPSVSIVRGEPFFALGPTIACVLSLICGLIVGTDRDRARQLLHVIAWSGAAYAVYGILSYLIEPTMLLWREKRAYAGNLTGTFVNRNTAAAYFGSCAVVWLAILLEQTRRHLRMDKIVWKKVPARLVTATPRSLIVSFSMFFICLMAMFLTSSRAGVVLSLLALMVTFIVYFRRDLPPRSGIWIALGASGLVALALLQFLGGAVSNRFDVQGLADEGRLAAYLSTIRMIADYPWFGTGLGTFAWSFPAYRSAEISMWGVWDIAHNTPLELASEVGLPLASAVCIGWLVAASVLVNGIRVRNRDVIIPLAAFSVSIIANLHSWIDFSLQIPGYAIIVFALVGAGLSQSFPGAATHSARRRSKSASKISTTA
ncbi:MAG: O-antigen ligase family protein [Pseudolabrys sp.]|nr:O-antigen ligase family protein [Pseudolabrys sp.]